MTPVFRLFAGLAVAGRAALWLAASGLAWAAGASWVHAMLLMVAVALGGCAALPEQVARPPSFAHDDVSGTTLARIESVSTPVGDDTLSGFRLLPDGAQALEARMALIRRAERTLDVQYYLIASDGTGLEFLGQLERAAARGVRVRVLVDDLYATGQDALFADLAAHDHIEVRLFNPLPVRGGSIAQRIALSMHQFSRINHRMHNKLFIADGTFAVTGGRNIADAYFGRGGDANFIDMDVLSAGPVVTQLAAVFDRYWNSDLAYPVHSLAGPGVWRPPPGEAAANGDLPATLPAPSTFEAELSNGRIALEAGRAEVFADAPQKADGDNAAPTVAQAHLSLLDSATSEALLASPYFVPGEPTMQVLNDLRSRAVRVSVLTNSLATTDEPLVHLGYARHRTALLEAGVDLHELMPSGPAAAEPTTSLGGSGRSASPGRLHTKLTVVDDEAVFVGSMNMDARSADVNTESAIVIHSVPLARLAASLLRGRQRDGSYALRLQGGQLRWLSGEGTGQQVRSTEPQPSSTPALPIRVLAQLLGEGAL